MILINYRKFIGNHLNKHNKLDLIKYFKNSEEFNNKFIPSTRNRIFSTIAMKISELCENEICLVFEQYLRNNIFVEKEAEMCFKAYDFIEEKSCTLIQL
jgi:hypothetical protein